MRAGNCCRRGGSGLGASAFLAVVHSEAQLVAPDRASETTGVTDVPQRQGFRSFHHRPCHRSRYRLLGLGHHLARRRNQRHLEDERGQLQHHAEESRGKRSLGSTILRMPLRPRPYPSTSRRSHPQIKRCTDRCTAQIGTREILSNAKCRDLLVKMRPLPKDFTSSFALS